MALVIVSRTHVNNWYHCHQAVRWVVIIDGEPAWIHTTGSWDEQTRYAVFLEEGHAWKYNGVYATEHDIMRAAPGRLLRSGKVTGVLLVDLRQDTACPMEVEPLRKEA